MQNGEVFLKEHCGKLLFASTCELAQCRHFKAELATESHKSRVVFVIKYHFMAYYDGMYPLVYFWCSPLPRSAVLFLVVDHDL
jgi:hypothetical protein